MAGAVESDGEMLTPQQVAERLKVSDRHVRRLCVEGVVSPRDGRAYRLAAFKVRGRVRIPASALEDFIAASEYTSAVPYGPPPVPESPARRLRRAAKAKAAALKACRGEV